MGGESRIETMGINNLPCRASTRGKIKSPNPFREQPHAQTAEIPAQRLNRGRRRQQEAGTQNEQSGSLLDGAVVVSSYVSC